MKILDALFGLTEIDDISVLPNHMQSVYQNPFRILGLDDSAGIGQIRDAFRKNCLNMVSEFTTLHNPKITLEQLFVAYHLCRKTLTGPAKKLAIDLKTSPYLFEIRPDDILPILRPVKSNFNCPPEYRGVRQLTIICTDYRTSLLSNTIPKTIYTFDVHYCMRRHTIDLEYDQVLQLNMELCEELLLVPAFPTRTTMQQIGVTGRKQIGEELADFIIRVHRTLSKKGLFSPRLLSFLNIPYEQIQSEEEGQIVHFLDSPILPPKTVWHIIDEGWLSKWRRFALGRDARRYAPPGKITNGDLLKPEGKEPKQGLLPARDYRCVNYNVWRFYEMVHGGGPVISRKFDDIYSLRALSYLQAVIMTQGFFACFVAKRKRDAIYTQKLSSSVVAKTIMTKASESSLSNIVTKRIETARKDRKGSKLEQSARLTQNIWRRKKGYVPEENLERRKRDQEVFARAMITKNAEGVVAEEAARGGDGIVVEDVHPIVHIGNTGIYNRVLAEEDGLPFTFKRLPGSEVVIIEESDDNERFKIGSKILSINFTPTASLTYDVLKSKLKSASFPLHLELSSPLSVSHVKPIEDLILVTDADLRYRNFKLVMSVGPDNGLKIRKHNLKNNNYHDSGIFISETERKKGDNPWTSISLYNLKYVLSGEDSKEIRSRFGYKGLRGGFQRKDRQELVNYIELVTEERSFYFEVLGVSPMSAPGGDDVYEETRSVGSGSVGTSTPRQLRRPSQMSVTTDSGTATSNVSKVLFEGLTRLIEEAKSSRWYVDKNGLPLRRGTAKTTLRKIT